MMRIPSAVSEAFRLEEGDALILRVEGQCAIVARNPDLLALAGAVQLPVGTRGMPLDEFWRLTRRVRRRRED